MLSSEMTNTIDLPTKARTCSDGEEATVCTKPPEGLINSPQTVKNESFSPRNVGAGLEKGQFLRHERPGIDSFTSCYTSPMYAKNTRAFMSALSAADKTLFGRQLTNRAVDLIGFRRRFDTHLLLSSLKERRDQLVVLSFCW